MNNLRIKFYREASVKFISHLDILKVFDRSMRRAGIQIVHSQGFNPHPKMVFGVPLSVGVVSECEYADIEIAQDISLEDFKQKLNLNLPVGIKIISAEHNSGNGKIMGQIKAAKYKIILKHKEDSLIKKEDIETFMKKNEMIAEKKTKKGMKNINLKPLIIDYSISENDEENSIELDILVKAGQDDNLKPRLLINILPFEFYDINIIRKALFAELNEILVDPMDKRIIGY